MMIKLNYLIVSVCIGVSLSACTSDRNTARNLDLIDQYVQAVEAKDIEKMASLLHDDYKGYGPSVRDSTDKVI
jgi:hypothetical protein